ncbi:predicted protein [Naegleria gruberi]|uniref:Predicted protein n=1 Tax=Naegleria gruberi TaxID=5762 RepID=D2VMU9_NAEGR|nr:uncharacterized protein NAEGRDRAFT_70268 [Naegleria gruberi]EFC41805.1 predicted protein [Naegleria gruberi]|eukprot:XP_002674549.1 predicted protein [Naegleria gruberi strain NEG-M]
MDQHDKLLKEAKNLIQQINRQLDDLENQYSNSVSHQIHNSNTRTYKRRVSNGEKLSYEESLEGGYSYNSDASRDRHSINLTKESLFENVKTLSSYEKTLKNYFSDMPRGKQKDKWQIQITTLSHDVQNITNTMNKLNRKHTNFENERKLLELDGEDERRSFNNNDNELESALTEYGVQGKSMDNSIRLIEQMKQVGIDSLGMLSDQRSTLKIIHEKLIGMGSTLGISQSTMRSIERRYVRDKYIIMAGMIFITLLLIFVYYYFKK